MLKDAIAIALITLAIICGAITGIVGGASGMAATAAVIRIAVGS